VVAGIGASAGGLEAFTQLLRSLPPRPGAAFVLVQHLDPTHDSILPSLLAKATAMPVREAKDGTRLEVDQVHVIPPAMDIAISDGHLRLVPRPDRPAPHMPLDLFLGSLAEVQGSRAIAVILSGTGTDGTLGCKAVRAAGGIVFAQEPASAKYDGMPRSVIAAGGVDFVLPPEGIARELVRLARAPYVRVRDDEAAPPATPDPRGSLQRIFALLKKATGADFSLYKKTTLMRRIQRRMVLHKIGRIPEYAQHLENQPAEVEALHQDLLINVTSFFRDPETFEMLKAAVFPRILKDRSADSAVRVWVPGCATGEEAYSVAMCLLESLSELPSNPPLQVFATDLSEAAIGKARAGVYPENIAAQVSPERLQRFFVKVDGYYHVSKTVRDVIVFARQDLARDPPFSRLDLVSCRNVLIYLEADLQRKILHTFHYALGPAGVLVLGTSETIGAAGDLFETVDRENRVYAKLGGNGAASRDEGKRAPGGKTTTDRPATVAARTERRSDTDREAERILLSRYAPASVLVDGRNEVLHFRGEIENFLGPAEGTASLNLLKMAPKGLVIELRRLLRAARKEGTPQKKENIALRDRGRSRRVGLEVIPLKGPISGEKRMLVLFEERSRGVSAPAVPAAPVASRGGNAAQRRIAQLEEDLEALRHYQQVVEDEQAASQEELQSANEEVLSSNEELQSINEEMETAKEELQSSNEELTTLNEELQNRNLELQRLTDDLDNFLASTTLPLVMLGRDLVVRRFTPAATKLLHVEPADIGRPFGHVRTGIDIAELESVAREVIETMQAVEREVHDDKGCWWRLHVRPYRTRQNQIDGAVLALVDIDALKRSREIVEDARDFADAIVNTAREPMLVLDAQLRIRRANRAFYDLFRVSPTDTEEVSIYEIHSHQWDVPALRSLLEETLPRGDSFEDYVVEHEFPSIGPRTIKLKGRKLRQPQGKEEMILLAMEDVTDQARLEEDRANLLRGAQEAKEAAEAQNRLKDNFVATASHELRGPLNAMVGWVHVLSNEATDDATRARAMAAIDRSIKQQSRLVGELLDVTRIMTGKLQLSMRLVELLEVVESALQAVRPTALAKGIDIGLASDTSGESVLGDPDRLHQVVWNILSNAVKFTPKGGRVEVWVGRVGTSAQLRTTDTGQGIAPEFLPHVFERFRQADSSPSRAQPGLGLGLAIARQLVEMHGGTVTAESAGEGQGSTFVVSLPIPALRVELPATTADVVADASAPMWPPRSGHLRDLRVMVVEDDPDSREVVTTVLERAGATVTAVASVGDALLAFAKSVPDVLVSDIGMPTEDGYALIRHVRRWAPDAGGHTPAIALTAYAADADKVKALASGFQAYLAKPAEPDQLVALVAGLAGRPSP
jgi:two-component system CheB/CheR fusion protein